MTLLMIAGALGFCVFMQLCLDNMAFFKVDKKRDKIFLIISIAFVITLETFSLFAPAGISPGSTFLEPFRLLIALGGSIAVLTLLYKNVLKALIFSAYLTGFLVGVMSISVTVLSLMGYGPYFGETLVPYGLAVYAVLGVVTSASILIKRFLKKRTGLLFLHNRLVHLLLIFSGVTLLFIYVNIAAVIPYITLGSWAINLGDVANILFFVSNAIMLVIVISYISQETAAKTERLLAEASKNYIRDLEESYNALRTIKHDYVNILTSFKLYIDNEDMKGLAKYYYDELSEMNKELLHQNRLMGSLENVRLNEVKSILIYKCSQAAQHEISINIEIWEPIERLGVSTAIVCQTLGILLDNAIESILEADEKKLSIAIVKNPNSKAFIIKNTWREQDIPIGKLFELGFSTKPGGSGVGLYTVRNYIEKIKGLYLETETSGRHFTQTLTVKDG